MLKTLIAPLSVGVLVLTAQTASAAIVEQDTFDVDNEFWSVRNNVDPLTVQTSEAGGVGVLQGLATSNDPQIQRGPVGKDLDQTWTTFTATVREFNEVAGVEVPVPLGVGDSILVFQNPNGQMNFGSGTIGGADANGFVTLTWDISGYELNSTGIVRLDPVGGLGTSGNTFEIDTITFEAVAVPEPASLALLGLGTLAILGRRRG